MNCFKDFIVRLFETPKQRSLRNFANFMSKPILQVIEQAPIMSDLFTKDTYSIPLNTFNDDKKI